MKSNKTKDKDREAEERLEQDEVKAARVRDAAKMAKSGLELLV